MDRGSVGRGIRPPGKTTIRWGGTGEAEMDRTKRFVCHVHLQGDTVSNCNFSSSPWNADTMSLGVLYVGVSIYHR